MSIVDALSTTMYFLKRLMCKKPSNLFLTQQKYTTLAATNCTKSEQLKTLCSKGLFKEAFNSFNSEIWADPNLFSHILHGIIPTNSLSLAKQLHALIISSGCFADRFVSNHLLNVYAKFGELNICLRLFELMPRKNVMSSNILIGGFIQTGDLVSAQKVFDEMLERNIATWNAMVTGFIHFEFNEEGLRFFSDMNKLGFLPDQFTLGSVLRGCAGLRSLVAGRQVHCYAIKTGFEFNLVVSSSLAHMYMKSGSLENGEKVISAMPVQTVVAWNTLIAGKAQNGCAEDVLDQYNMMKIAGFRPDKITFVSVISSCSELATLGQGQQIHAEVIKIGVGCVVPVISSLISMYSKCGVLKDSIKAFLGCEDIADVVLWSSMIAAYGFHGQGEKAIELFHQMADNNLEANEVTFLSLLYSCSHSGMKREGTEIFNLMIEKYKLKPRVEHHTCMVDLLGRSGNLDEAEAMIKSMCVKPDAVIWKTLLSACKTHKNGDMARKVAQEVIKLDPQDSASYVLLANTHAKAERWEEVSNVRKAMRLGNLKKEPGVSWLEMKNQVHQFCMADKLHPNAKDIDLYLKELTKEMKLRGYVPDTSSVLHDMDNEEMEDDLAHHSEKIAIAFALMYSHADAPITVMKNLRICDDCHAAIKCISDLKNREIVVRDASRFHHFRNGKCSCGDYW